ncbi:uncharacterized protein [Nicotiana tomentosiformis]|uniref:uncharacterized protein n=1 Tax=Nicotiana tomentosiformis TaxID=4098 RepID=UPI00388C7333
MPGLSADFVVHKLPTYPNFSPIQQKQRKFKTYMGDKIKEEITKQLSANVIRVIRYTTWLANVVPVPKKDGKIRLKTTSEPIFKLLKKNAAIKWTDECQEAFDKIKEYLSNPPILVLPEPGKKEQAIFYLSKKFTTYESKYTLLERTCCALTWVAQKLRHYLLAYTIYLISRMDPLKYIFQKPMPTGRLAKWQILLTEFDIVYVTRTAMKAQALADHLAENPVGDEYESSNTYFPDEEVEAITLKEVTKKVVVDFVHSNIICRFGIPKTIIIDNAANLNSHLIKEVCEKFKIEHRNSTPYRPKANGYVEAANKNNKKILRKMVQGSRKWHEKLPFALLGYQTTVRTSYGATPYLLVYGTKAVIPAEVEIPSLRIIIEVGIEDTDWVKSRLEQLSLTDGKRLAAVCFGQLYQQRMARTYNKKVRPRQFEVGQLVLKCIFPY